MKSVGCELVIMRFSLETSKAFFCCGQVYWDEWLLFDTESQSRTSHIMVIDICSLTTVSLFYFVKSLNDLD